MYFRRHIPKRTTTDNAISRKSVSNNTYFFRCVNNSKKNLFKRIIPSTRFSLFRVRLGYYRYLFFFFRNSNRRTEQYNSKNFTNENRRRVIELPYTFFFGRTDKTFVFDWNVVRFVRRIVVKFNNNPRTSLNTSGTTIRKFARPRNARSLN